MINNMLYLIPFRSIPCHAMSSQTCTVHNTHNIDGADSWAGSRPRGVRFRETTGKIGAKIQRGGGNSPD